MDAHANRYRTASSRKPHRKSRLACGSGTCKRRRVKVRICVLKVNSGMLTVWFASVTKSSQYAQSVCVTRSNVIINQGNPFLIVHLLWRRAQDYGYRFARVIHFTPRLSQTSDRRKEKCYGLCGCPRVSIWGCASGSLFWCLSRYCQAFARPRRVLFSRKKGVLLPSASS